MTNVNLPEHVAIIMDGNGRWAKAKHLPRTQGHLEGVRRVEEIVSIAREMGIKVLSLYAFSTENWNRPEDEVSLLMKTFISVLGQKAKDLHAHGIKINFIGRRSGIPEAVLKAMDSAACLTQNNQEMTLNIAFNYGSRAELVDAFKSVYRSIVQGQLTIEDINEQVLERNLYTSGQPNVDLLIRTSGEIRISNFLLWQISYAELYFTDKFWPDFTPQEFQVALKEYSQRDRRYGGITQAV